jgi:hypothetical protein
MTKREISSLLIKLLGIYSLFQVVPSLSGILSMIFTISHYPGIGLKLLYMLTTTIGPALWITFCIIVICKSDAVAKLLFKEDSAASQVITLGFRDLMVLGFCFIGILLVVQSLPYLISNAISIRSNQISNVDYTNTDQYKTDLSHLTAYLIQTIIGALLFFKASKLADCWEKFQLKAGMSEKIQSKEE